jgi:hypothetical protein
VEPESAFESAELHDAPVAQLDRASAFEVGSVNHISAASGVAYTETRGATNLLNWTEVGPKSVGPRRRARFVGLSR